MAKSRLRQKELRRRRRRYEKRKKQKIKQVILEAKLRKLEQQKQSPINPEQTIAKTEID